ncbi:MAG: hypothetical protein ABIS35_01475 [Terracoccus sp.]
MSTSSPFMERVRLEDGFFETDLPLIEPSLSQLFHHLGRFDASMVYIGLRVKDRDQPGMRTAIELCVSGLPTLVGMSELGDVKEALHDAETKVISQLVEAADRRRPHRGKQPVR